MKGHLSEARRALSEGHAQNYHPLYRAGDLGRNKKGWDIQPLYRGMLIDVPVKVANAVRKILNYGEYSDDKDWPNKKGSKLSYKQVIDLLMKEIRGEGVGLHWTEAPRIAGSFAKAWSVGPKDRRKLAVILEAKPPGVGYRPAEADIFWDEAEKRMPKGTPIEIIGISVFMLDEYEGYWTMLFKDKDRPIKVKA